MNVNLNLIILHLDLKTLAHGCLLNSDQNIISRSLTNNDIVGELRDILLEYLEIDPDWVKFNLMDVISKKDSIVIAYSCLLPSIIKKKQGNWFTIGEINDTATKAFIFKAAQRIAG